MSRQVSPSTSRPYGILRVTRLWGRSRATLYRHGRADPPRCRRRPGPVGPMPDEALVEAIRKLLVASPFHGEGHRKVWARLRFAGIRTSKRRVLRLMREHDLLAPSRVGRPHGPSAHDGTIRTERVDDMWGTDLTSTITGEGQASIFVTVDHCSTECVGIHAARRATRFEALEPLRQGVRACFGTFVEGVAGGLKLRHDHGSQFVADDYQRELAFLGIASSPAFVREPEGNGCVERFIRTLKENLLWVCRFDTIEELRLALHAFKRTYNHTWIVERHGYQSPAAVRAAQLAPLPAAASNCTAVSHNCGPLHLVFCPVDT
jgi:putative transposase